MPEFEGKDGRWVTIYGRKVFIPANGQPKVGGRGGLPENFHERAQQAAIGASLIPSLAASIGSVALLPKAEKIASAAGERMTQAEYDLLLKKVAKSGSKVIHERPTIFEPLKKIFPKALADLPGKVPVQQVVDSAAFPKIKLLGQESAIAIPKPQQAIGKMLYPSRSVAYHELGHIKDYKKLPGLKMAVRTGGMIGASAMPFYVAMKKRIPGEKEPFVYKHATKLAALGTLPMLSQEAKATIIAAKMLKKQGVPMIKTLKKLGIPYSTYLLTAGAIVGSTALAKYIKERKMKKILTEESK